MKFPFASVFLAFCLLPLCISAQTEEQKKVIGILKRAGDRLMSGDITALDDVKALPGDDSVAGLLMFFKQYFYVFSKETEKKAIAKKAAIYITECPTAGPYIKRLFKKEAGRPKSGMLANYRQTTLDALTDAKNGFAVRTLFELMDETELEVQVGDFSIALAKMSLPSAPYTRDARKGASTPEGIAKWQEWWQQNKAQY
jgi:hypothetical protein